MGIINSSLDALPSAIGPLEGADLRSEDRADKDAKEQRTDFDNLLLLRPSCGSDLNRGRHNFRFIPLILDHPDHVVS
jgi:hypothetical protein